MRHILGRTGTGSSPLTRGAPFGLGVCHCLVGIIPAYAGSTPRHPPSYGCSGDHPRLRGEHSSGSLSHLMPGGSSPLTRGAPIHRALASHIDGIIPAYAVSTMDWLDGHHRVQDHPRLRGEHQPTSKVDLLVRGSSPLTRGARKQPGFLAHRRGIIPAYAGSTYSSAWRSPGMRDHPRLRGEHAVRAWNGALPEGSSPLTRGALHEGGRTARSGGIIPAYAGSTTTEEHMFKVSTDHPRLRGEHPRIIC